MPLHENFGGRLYHLVPPWVEQGSIFHIRIRCFAPRLTEPSLASALLESVRFYEARHEWHIVLWLLMPDHLHALLSFAPEASMSQTLGNWKSFQAKRHAIRWQKGYFDHRLRDDERGEQMKLKMDYIRQNPVVRGLCVRAEDWPWVYPR